MKSQFNNTELGRQIFMERQPVSQKEMEAYLNGELDKSEMHEIELRLEANDMSAEALEGFQAHPEALAGLEQVRQDFKTKLAKKRSWTTTHTLATAGVVAISVIGVAYFLNNPETDTSALLADSKDSTLVETSLPDLVHFTFSEPIEITEEIELEVDEAKELPQDQQLTAAYIEQHQPVTVEATASMPEAELDSLVQTVIELEPLEPILNDMPEAVEPEKVVKSNVKILFLNDLLVVDYSDLHDQGIEQKKLAEVNTGTPVWMENKDDHVNEVNKEPVYETTYIPYVDFLRETQGKFDRNQYKAALKDYHKILKQYPQDVNALFYGGLCYYNLDKPERAIQYFDNVISNSVNTFHPEGQFYKALSLRAMGKYGQGNGILLKIAEQGGFYAEQAKEIIDQ